jgi:hypothetical protein
MVHANGFETIENLQELVVEIHVPVPAMAMFESLLH